MISKVILHDFFSFKGTQPPIELNSGVNLLLGINGSGKTSFLNAFRLLYEGVAGIGFEPLFQGQWGGFSQVANANGEAKVPFIKMEFIFNPQELKRIAPTSPFSEQVHYCVTIKPLGATGYTLSEHLYADGKDGASSYTYLDFKNGVGKLTVREDGKVKHEQYKKGDVSGQELILRQITDPMRYLPMHTIRKAIESMSIYSYFDTSKLRVPSEYNGAIRLKKDGDNLAQLVNHFAINKTLTYNKIIDCLSNVNSAYKGIEFQNFASSLYLTIREHNLDKTVGARHLSDGTLRFLLLMSIFYNPERGSIVGIDEPETGLHPDMIKSLGEMINDAARDSQLLVATHSPLLLNLFDLEDVLVFEKDKNNETIVKRISEADYPESEDFLVGQMWLRGQIGATRW